MTRDPLRVAVFASGGGTNFQALVEHTRAGGFSGSSGSSGSGGSWRPVLLVSDREGAGALERARAAGIDTAVVPTLGRPPAEVAQETVTLLEAHRIDALLLAGYLKLVPAEVVHRHSGRVANIHPALLPAFGGAGMYGMNVHRAVLASGACLTGATVHLVNEEYDRGTIVAQWPVPVLPGDSAEDLAARVLAVEHDLYPRTVDHMAEAWSEGRTPGPLVEPGDAFRLAEDRCTSDAPGHHDWRDAASEIDTSEIAASEIAASEIEESEIQESEREAS